MTVELYQSGQSVEQLADVLKMKKMARIKEENDILKKALSIFAQK